MALIRVQLERDGPVVEASGMPSLKITLQPQAGGLTFACVWDDLVESLPISDDTDGWFSEFLALRCRLVYLPDEPVGPGDSAYGRPGDQVDLADGFPFLLISEASLADLNVRLERPVPMTTAAPVWSFEAANPSPRMTGSWCAAARSPSARCHITTVNQGTAAVGKEPLRTLTRVRRCGTRSSSDRS
jgi:uncharacterized protein YcbX